MSDSNTILSHIVSITESRDMEILEMSLLRTIFEVIECKKVFLVKSSADNTAERSISGYDSDGYSGCEFEIPSVLQKLVDVYEENPDGIQDSDESRYSIFTIIPVDVLRNRIGFIAVEIPDKTDIMVHLLEGLVRIYQNYVAILLENQTDTLTGILNRKTFDDRIMKLIELRKREKCKVQTGDYKSDRRTESAGRFWLGIFDIDDFKKVNDTFGHVYGDEILILISRIMQTVFRSTDMKFRFGGEEFIVVIKAEDSGAAYSVFERFRKEVENYRFPQTGRITVSTGIVEITGEESPSVFVGCADNAMYYAKQNGKNMTCIYSELVERGLIAPESVKKGGVILF